MSPHSSARSLPGGGVRGSGPVVVHGIWSTALAVLLPALLDESWVLPFQAPVSSSEASRDFYKLPTHNSYSIVHSKKPFMGEKAFALFPLPPAEKKQGLRWPLLVPESLPT